MFKKMKSNVFIVVLVGGLVLFVMGVGSLLFGSGVLFRVMVGVGSNYYDNLFCTVNKIISATAGTAWLLYDLAKIYKNHKLRKIIKQSDCKKMNLWLY